MKAEEDNNQSDADNLRARLKTRKTELAVCEEKIAEVQGEKKMLT